MNNQAKITINNKDYYCDMEVLEVIDRLNDKVELLEYNRDKAIEYIENEFYEVGGCVGGSDLPYQPIQDLLNILEGKNNEC